MYSFIWRRLPFGLPGKLVGSMLLATAAVALLWFVIFPWAEPLLPFDDVQVTQDNGEPGGPAAPVGSPGAGVQPTLGEHDLPYDTNQNNTGPTPTTRSR